MQSCEIEVNTGTNSNVLYGPITEAVRGRVVVDQKMPRAKRNRLEALKITEIPGQRIGVTAEGERYVAEPLRDDEHSDLRKMIVKRGLEIADARKTYQTHDAKVWGDEMKRLVDGNHATLVSGSLPKTLGDRPNFFTGRPLPGPSNNDRLAVAIEKLTDMLDSKNSAD